MGHRFLSQTPSCSLATLLAHHGHLAATPLLSAHVECSVLLVLLFPSEASVEDDATATPPFSGAIPFTWGICVLIKVFLGSYFGEFCHTQAPLLSCKSDAEAPKGPAWLLVHLQDGEIDLKLLTKVLAPEHEVREVQYSFLP